MSVPARTLNSVDQTERVWLVFDGDLLGVHASHAGAADAKDAYIAAVMASAQPGEPEADREYPSGR